MGCQVSFVQEEHVRVSPAARGASSAPLMLCSAAGSSDSRAKQYERLNEGGDMAESEILIEPDPNGRTPVTIRSRVEREGRYIRQTSEPGAFGHVFLRFEPADQGGLRLRWDVGEETIASAYMPFIARGISEVLLNDHRFEKSFLTRTIVTVIGGSQNITDSSGFAFKVAAVLAFQAMLDATELEPCEA
jgi:hypothetical protein